MRLAIILFIQIKSIKLSNAGMKFAVVFFRKLYNVKISVCKYGSLAGFKLRPKIRGAAKNKISELRLLK